jgi:thioredoxin reductase (NADPH)
MYDALIIGGGPAGLSAAVYLARFTRSVLVVDAGAGRSSFAQVNENYLGFPDGVTTRDLRDLGRRQAERFGAVFKDGCVERVERTEEAFQVCTTVGDFAARTLLLATGVTDVWPDVPRIRDFIGHQVFWCITCDGFRARGKTVVCIGNTDEAAVTVLQMRLFTDRLALVADPEKMRFSPEVRQDLQRNGIPLCLSRPEQLSFSEDSGTITALELADGTVLPCEMLFALLGVRPNTALAREIGLALDTEGYIVMDEEGYTSLPGVFAAGDLTRMYTQQVASAVHAGAEAAQTMNYYLYHRDQRNLPDRDRSLYLREAEVAEVLVAPHGDSESLQR